MADFNLRLPGPLSSIFQEFCYSIFTKSWCIDCFSYPWDKISERNLRRGVILPCSLRVLSITECESQQQGLQSERNITDLVRNQLDLLLYPLSNCILHNNTDHRMVPPTLVVGLLTTKTKLKNPSKTSPEVSFRDDSKSV